MGKTKQSEAERHRKLRLNRKKELNKSRALWEFLTKKHPKILEAFEVEYANQPSTSQGPNSNEISEEPLKAPQPTPEAIPQIEDSNQLPEEPLNTPQPTFEAIPQTEDSNQLPEEPLNTPQPTFEAIPQIEDSNQLPEEPLNTPQSTFEAFSTPTPQIDLIENILYNEFLTELNGIDF